MSLLSRHDLKLLIERHEGPCISIYLPTYRAGKNVEQNPIRFKNLLREAEARLASRGLRTSDVSALLEPAQQLLADGYFWRNQSDGLAVFLAPDSFHHYRLPVGFQELAVVTDRFHVKPILPLLSGAGQFYVLALSQKEVRLLQGTRYSVSEVDLEGVPESLAEVLEAREAERKLQLHTHTPGGGGQRVAMFHGHGIGLDETKENIVQYFRQINGGLRELFREQQAPLVLAGVEYYFPLYQEANTYPYLLEEGITGNPEGLTVEALHQQAWTLVEPYFRRAEQEAARQYRELIGTGLASNNLTEVIPAAYHGRVETLFVSLGVQQWGTFDPETNGVEIASEARPTDEDLLDFAAVHTLLTGGTVYAVKLENMPDAAPVAALFRY